MKEYLPYINTIGTVIAFCFTAFKYIHSQKIKQTNKRFEQFNQALDRVAGRTAEGNLLVNVQQAAAVYQLGGFPEYKEMSLPIIEYYIDQTACDKDDDLFRAALLKTRIKLS